MLDANRQQQPGPSVELHTQLIRDISPSKLWFWFSSRKLYAAINGKL